MTMPRLKISQLSGCQQQLCRKCINLKTLRLRTRIPKGDSVAAFLWCRLVQIYKPDHKVPTNFYSYLYEQASDLYIVRDTIASVERLISSILWANKLPGQPEPEHVPLITNFYHD